MIIIPQIKKHRFNYFLLAPRRIFCLTSPLIKKLKNSTNHPMNNSLVSYKCKNIEEKKTIYKLLYALGFINQIHGSLQTVLNSIDREQDMGNMYPNVNISNKTVNNSWNYLPNNFSEFQSIGELMNHIITQLNTFSATIKLNDSHTAVVTKQGIKVGCQTFSHAAIKELYETSVKAQNS